MNGEAGTGPDIALVFISYNTRADLAAALDSVRRLPEAGELRVIVVDNGSTDGSIEMVRDEYPEARLIVNAANGGYSQACNLGILDSDTPYVMVLNSDIEFNRGGPREMAAWMEANPGVGAAGPRVLNTDGSVQYSCRDFPSLPVSLGHAFLGELFPDNPFTRSYHMKGCGHDRDMAVEWVSGAAMMLRRTATEEVGGFDEGYFMYVEDVDLCWRLRQSGWEIRYYPEVEILHHIARSSSQQSTRMLYQHHRSMFRFYRRRHAGPSGMLFSPFIAAAIAARFGFVLVLGRLRRRSGRC